MTDTTSQRTVRRSRSTCIYYAASVAFFLYMFYYYWTGIGGPTLLAMGMIPVAFVLFTLHSLRTNEFYPKLPPIAELRDRRRLLRLRALLRLLHEHELHVARRRALGHVGHARTWSSAA